MISKSMDTAEIKKQVLIEDVVEHYGGNLNGEGVGCCLFPEKHNNNDANPSMQVKNGRVYCRSQQCFGGRGADVFDLVGIMEDLPTFEDQKRRVMEIAGLNSATQAKPTTDATYNYTDEDGKPLFRVEKRKPKAFRQQKPDGKGGWTSNLKGVRRVLYRLHEVIKATNVVVLEGEKDVDTACRLGLPKRGAATCNPMGAGKWRPEYSEMLRGKHVVIVPDADAAGKRHADQVAKALQGIAPDIRMLTLPEGKDLSEWVELGGSAETFQSLLQGAQPWECEDAAEPSGGGETGFPRQKSPPPGSLLIDLARRVELFHTPLNEAYATVDVSGHKENLALTTKEFQRWLVDQYYEKRKTTPSTQALQNAIAQLEHIACARSSKHEIHVRVAGHNGDIYLDLGNDAWEICKITSTGWKVIPSPASPVKFRRPRGMQPLPHPLRGGSIDDLKAFVNIGNQKDFILLVCFLVKALDPRGPFPVLFLNGSQGSAKSTLARIIRNVFDPNVSALRAGPRNERDLMISAINSWSITLDNVSSIPSWLSDCICRLSTGAGFSTRELYSDHDEVIFQAVRPIVLNGIGELPTRGDLLDRALIINLPDIPDNKRRTEEEFWKEFTTAYPRLLGALLDAVVAALDNISTVQVPTLPRLADFAKLGVAVERGLGWPPGSFMEAYDGNLEQGHDIALDATSVAQAVMEFMEAKVKWQGTATELLHELSVVSGDSSTRQRDWPKSPRKLSNLLYRLTPNLRTVGIRLTRERDTHTRVRRRLIILEQMCAQSSNGSASSDPGVGPAENSDAQDDTQPPETNLCPNTCAREISRSDHSDETDAAMQTPSSESTFPEVDLDV